MSTTKRGGKAGRRLATETRKRRMEAALERMAKDETISSRDMKSLLSPRQYSDYESKWDFEKSLRQDAKEAGEIFAKYNNALRKGDLLDGKGEKFHRNSALTQKFHAQAEAAYEASLEVLEETLFENPGAERHLDRQMFSDAVFGCDKGGVPRVKYSPRNSIAYEHDAFTSKADLKERALRDALEAPNEEPEEAPTQASRDLVKKMVADLKKYG
jgi:hypothetical protein